tara:strand:+ start:3060 stop:4169 length:1110 start_codon:yes stop_codon:yes gene_type:complete
MAGENQVMNPIGISRLGASNLGTDKDALFLKVFSGEVLQVFEENNALLPLVRQRTISSGKSAQFPVTGVATAKYHTPGDSIMASGLDADAAGGNTGDGILNSSKYLTNMSHTERVISIDGMLVSSAFIGDIDEAKNHYDVRSAYSTQIGRELAYHADKALIRTCIAGARKTADRFGGSDAKFLGDQVALDADSDGVEGSEIVTGLFTVAQKMDEASVPTDGRYCVLSPANYYKLVNTANDSVLRAINRDFGNEGNGSIARGEIVQVAGLRILKSNHIPSANESSSQDAVLGDDLINNDVFTSDGGYSGANFTTTEGICFQTEGLGTVKLLDLAMESEYQLDRLGTLMVAKYAMGHGILREECLFELTTS